MKAEDFKAMADENRLRIIERLKEGECCACELLAGLSLTQSTLSHHMKLLSESGLVNSRKDGKWMRYSLSSQKLSEFRAYFDDHLLEKETHETLKSEKIQLYFLSGFLGAGKTTVMNTLLKEFEGKKTAVIMNEFGKVSVDGAVLRRGEIEMIELNRGLIFCSCQQLSFANALVELSKQGVEVVLVESSGLADPSNSERVLEGVFQTAGDVYDFRGILTVVDAVHALDEIQEFEAAVRQIKFANLLLITKTDLTEEDDLIRLVEEIRKINDRVPILTSKRGVFSTRFLEEDLWQYGKQAAEESTNREDNRPKTFLLTFEEEVPKDLFLDFIDEVKEDAYRIKGFFDTEDGMFKLDVVASRVDCVPYENSELKNTIVIHSKVGNLLIKPFFEKWRKYFDIEMKLR